MGLRGNQKENKHLKGELILGTSLTYCSTIAFTLSQHRLGRVAWHVLSQRGDMGDVFGPVSERQVVLWLSCLISPFRVGFSYWTYVAFCPRGEEANGSLSGSPLVVRLCGLGFEAVLEAKWGNPSLIHQATEAELEIVQGTCNWEVSRQEMVKSRSRHRRRFVRATDRLGEWVWLKMKQAGQTAGFGPCFHLPGFHFGNGFLSHSHLFPTRQEGVVRF